MWVRRSLAAALVVAFVVGCSGSDSKTYTPLEVRDALRGHGFDVEVLSEQEQGDTVFGVLELFSGEEVAVEGVVADPAHPMRPGEKSVGGVVEAWILNKDNSDRTRSSCDDLDATTTCLQSRNVVVFVRKSRAKAAREALGDLN